MRKSILFAAVLALGIGGTVHAEGYKPYKPPSYSAPKTYSSPQPAYKNYGRTSSSTGRPMTNSVSGYVRRDGTYVNPYARSK